MARRRRSVPVTAAASSATSATSHAGRTVIRRYHTLLKRQRRLKDSPTDKDELRAVEAELADIPLDEYQRMSLLGQAGERGGGSEKVFVGWLEELGTHQRDTPLRLLEVGALRPDNYARWSRWIAPTCIDLNSRHAGILEQDFLEMDTSEHTGQWDAISLSLVLNFVPDAHDRGRMLRLAHSFLRAEGWLFLALPLPCVSNSRYLTLAHLKELLTAIGLNCLRERWRPTGKMVYLMCKRTERPSVAMPPGLTRKKVLLEGSQRNNFCILLD